MKFFKATLFISVLVVLAGCHSRFFSLTAPSGSGGSNGGLIPIDASGGQIPWSPYIVVHSDGNAIEGYRKALTDLKSKGMVKGVRIGLNPNRDSIVQMIGSLGIEIVGIIGNEELFDFNPSVMIDKYISAYPEIRVFQIGNEVTTINQLAGLPKMTIEEYMDVFGKIYDHVQSSHPSVTLMTQSTFGSGFYGSNELKRMVELGLRPDIFSPQRVIVGVNIYSDGALNEYISTRNRYLNDSNQGGYRVWVMETGSSNSNDQIAHVKLFYPRLHSSLGAERIYWYALWGGDTGSDVGYGLIGSPHDTSRMIYSSLFKALAGIQ